MTDILERIDWLYVAEIEAASPDPYMVKTYADAKAEIERLRGAEQDAAAWVDERTKRLRAENERLRAALIDIYDAFDELSRAEVDPSVKELARGVIQRANRWQES